MSSNKESPCEPSVTIVRKGPLLPELVPTTEKTHCKVNKPKTPKFNLYANKAWVNCVASSLHQLVSSSCPSSPKDKRLMCSTKPEISGTKSTRTHHLLYCDNPTYVTCCLRSRSVVQSRNQFKLSAPDVPSLNINKTSLPAAGP